MNRPLLGGDNNLAAGPQQICRRRVASMSQGCCQTQFSGQMPAYRFDARDAAVGQCEESVDGDQYDVRY